MTTTAARLWSKDGGEETLHLLEKQPKLKCAVKLLKYDNKNHTGPWDSENLYEILKLLPNLEVLETNMLTLSPSQKWVGDITSFSNGNPIKVELLIRKLQTLKRLKLDFVLGRSTSRCLFTHQQRFACIKSLELHAGGMIFMSDFLKHSNSANDWTITKFSLNLNDNYDIFLIRKFLTRISPSLQHLKFILNKEEAPASSTFSSSSSLSASSFEPWKDEWLIPLELNKLETLEIVSILPLSPEILTQMNQFMLKSIISALRLSSLKKLAVAFIPWNLEGVILNWNAHEAAVGRKLKSQSLEEVELLSYFSSPSSSATSLWKIPGKIWPGLKSLKCSWKNPESFDCSILSELTDLERIEIRLGNELNNAIDNTDSVGMGMNPNENSSRFHLRDLKNLKGFSLKVPRSQLCYRNFADGLVQNDFKFMKSLQCVQFHRIVIDGAPLKLALGPNFPIIFTK